MRNSKTLERMFYPEFAQHLKLKTKVEMFHITLDGKTASFIGVAKTQKDWQKACAKAVEYTNERMKTIKKGSKDHLNKTCLFEEMLWLKGFYPANDIGQKPTRKVNLKARKAVLLKQAA